MTPQHAMAAAWAIWVVSWLIAALLGRPRGDAAGAAAGMALSPDHLGRSRAVVRAGFATHVFSPVLARRRMASGRDRALRVRLRLVGAHSSWPAVVGLRDPENGSPHRRHRALCARAPSDLHRAARRRHRHRGAERDMARADRRGFDRSWDLDQGAAGGGLFARAIGRAKPMTPIAAACRCSCLLPAAASPHNAKAPLRRHAASLSRRAMPFCSARKQSGSIAAPTSRAIISKARSTDMAGR